MHHPSETSLYNLKVVLRETGIQADTLRAWERRYGLPSPERSEGGHRLYSQHDIKMIKWLLARQAEGMAISRAVALWNQLVDKGESPLGTLPNALPERGPDEQLVRLRESWIEACREFDEHLAEEILSEAFALYQPEVVCTDLLLTGLSVIGAQWYEGQATVQQEHFASELFRRRLHTLIAASPPPSRERILVTAPPEEEHDTVLLLLVLMLRRRGWDIIYLGANVPLENLEAAIEKAAPRLVVTAAQRLYTAAHLPAMAKTIRKTGLSLAFGGGIFTQIPQLVSRIPGYFLGDSINGAPDRIDDLVRSDLNPPSMMQVSAKTEEALRHFAGQVPQIDAALWHVLGGDVPGQFLTMANLNMARNIEASLQLGDMALLDPEIAWTHRLLSHYGVPDRSLEAYLVAYYHAVQQHLDSRGALIRAWFESRIAI
jgi:DNA-binding transcriptional MerR regulator